MTSLIEVHHCFSTGKTTVINRITKVIEAYLGKEDIH